ncbi:hypothetical protein FALCPG4_006970 [Fusarium falciforme]
MRCDGLLLEAADFLRQVRQTGRQTRHWRRKKGNSASDKRGGKGQEEGFLENETHNIELLFQWRGSPPEEEAHCPGSLPVKMVVGGRKICPGGGCVSRKVCVAMWREWKGGEGEGQRRELWALP